MAKRTPFYDLHLAANAKIVDFAGWDMPLHYGSQLEEHHQVRKEAGLFDVSHMGVVDLTGSDASAFLRLLLANNVDKLTIGKALYTCMLNEQGGVIDDLIVYKLGEESYRLIVNAGTREKDLAWMRDKANTFSVELKERNDLVMLALQGPQIPNKLASLFSSETAQRLKNLKPFTFSIENEHFVARTGYTGEDGYEIIFPATKASEMWQACVNAGIKPCGLGARDTLRLEAGLNLYGADMDDTTNPYESNLGWTIVLEPNDRKFIGREALEMQRVSGLKQKLVGLVLEGPGIIRNHLKVYSTNGLVGEVTSGGYSPTLSKSIALARVPREVEEQCFVEIRDKRIPAKVIKPPFVRFGKQMF